MGCITVLWVCWYYPVSAVKWVEYVGLTGIGSTVHWRGATPVSGD